MDLRIGVVGGSIAGCAAGAALLGEGFDVVVLERSFQAFGERGAGISLPPPLVERLKQVELFDDDIPCLKANKRIWWVHDGDDSFGRLIGVQPLVGEQHHWGVVFRNLRRRIDDRRYRTGTEVVSIDDGERGVTLTFRDGADETFDLVVGADGYRSSVRRLLFPDAEPRYAGYPAWRGILDEDRFDGAPLDGAIHTVGILSAHAVFYLVPGENGDLRPGHRRINWLIYDGAAPEYAAGRGVDEGGRVVVDSVAPGSLTAAQVDYLRGVAAERLPAWHREVIQRTPEPSMQSVYDLVLDRYVRGHACVIGDASTIARPHTGSGATKAIEDALELAGALKVASTLDEALAAFEAKRVPVGNALVQLGERLGREQVIEAPNWNQFDQPSFESWLRSGGSSQTYMFAQNKGG